jgi:hypothetical protein
MKNYLISQDRLGTNIRNVNNKRRVVFTGKSVMNWEEAFEAIYLKGGPGVCSGGADSCKVRKRISFEPFYVKNVASFYQDRLGTN